MVAARLRRGRDLAHRPSASKSGPIALDFRRNSLDPVRREPGRNDVRCRAQGLQLASVASASKAAIARTLAARPRSSSRFPAGVADTSTTRRSVSERSRCASPADSSALTILVIAGADTCSSSASRVMGCGPAKTNTDSSEARGPSRSRSASAARAVRSSRTAAECTRFAVWCRSSFGSPAGNCGSSR